MRAGIIHRVVAASQAALILRSLDQKIVVSCLRHWNEVLTATYLLHLQQPTLVRGRSPVLVLFEPLLLVVRADNGSAGPDGKVKAATAVEAPVVSLLNAEVRKDHPSIVELASATLIL